MGILFGVRPRSTDVHNTNALENFALSQIGNNSDSMKIYDDPQPVFQFIRAKIREQDPVNVNFIMDYS